MPLLKLDLGCGQSPREGFEGVDLYAPNAVHKVDLFKFPFPWADNSVGQIHCSHFLEHLPAREVMPSDMHSHASPEAFGKFVGQDFLLAFMDECYRVLIKAPSRPQSGAKPEGELGEDYGMMHVFVPNATSDRGFQDPTHRRFFVYTSWCYFDAVWRAVNKLDHYRANHDFLSEWGPIIDAQLATRHAEVQAQKFRHEFNTILDWEVRLYPIAPAPARAYGALPPR